VDGGVVVPDVDGGLPVAAPGAAPASDPPVAEAGAVAAAAGWEWPGSWWATAAATIAVPAVATAVTQRDILRTRPMAAARGSRPGVRLRETGMGIVARSSLLVLRPWRS